MKSKHQAAAQFSSPHEGRLGITYSRVSTKGQKADAQELRCRDYLAAANVPLDREFSDSYTGGGDFMQRPAMRELLTYIDASPQKSFLVVFDDLKRFARDTEFHLALRKAFKYRDVLLACLNYNFDESPEGRFAETVFAAQAELERHQNRRQVIQKMEARLRRGYWCFGQKKGYSIVKTAEHGKLLVPNADGRLLREGLEGFASGRFVRRIDLYRFLVERGFWPGQAPGKYIAYLTTFLRDPFYCGDIEYLPWGVERQPGRHEALISRDVFARIQARLAKAGGAAPIRSDAAANFPLRGLILCAGCQRPLTATHAKGRSKTYAYYYCFRRDCDRYALMFRKEDLERDFRELLERQRLTDKADGLLGLVFERAWRAELAEATGSAERRSRQRQALTDQVADYAKLAGETRSIAVRAAYETQIEEATAKLEALGATPRAADLDVPFQTALDKATKLLQSPIDAWDAADHLNQQRIFFLLFERKISYGRIERFQTANDASYSRLFEGFSVKEPRMVHPRSISSNGGAGCSSVDIEGRDREVFNRIKGYLTIFWQIYCTSDELQKSLEETA